MAARALWITGLPGSGKSSVADALRQLDPAFIILRMDDLRHVITPEPTYSDAERDIVYRSIVYLAKTVSDLGHPVIIDATGHLRKWRDFARQHIPSFFEIYLTCPLEECMKREQQRKQTYGAPSDIYRKGKEGWPVPGSTVPYEEPLHPDVVIDSGKTQVKDAANIIASFLKKQVS